ncbi:galactosylgalactosylxylosylprotein 3-beta-glucuronosyltransferase S-like [Penaeus chinensis]|uniref:galactosylgalactosylxylosylprotein 3-beta-glucuronosyltransferase S-like n=1 Tax=Penaeus chinensis TaxID=139456 RepID=UPI001FB6CA4C|nr:galactosylgalactosylxylosylprotein 3-beta-glucuronosyltransferase S-like [Penaeus chinensis]
MPSRLLDRAEMTFRSRSYSLLCLASFALVMLAFHEFSPGEIKDGDRARRGLLDYGRTIYVVTGTYQRTNQMPEMTQLAQTLMLVPNVHWIVAEDTRVHNKWIMEYLRFTGIPFTYLKTPTPRKFLKLGTVPIGASNSRAAIAWIRKNAKTGVVYFAHETNIYDYRLFEEIRSTRGVSLFPVGFATRLQLSTPVVKKGRFSGWYDDLATERKFPVEMAGFAFSVELLQQRPRANVDWSYDFQEESLLKGLGIPPERMELKAERCNKILVWTVEAVMPKPATREICDKQYDGTNVRILESILEVEGVSCAYDMKKKY